MTYLIIIIFILFILQIPLFLSQTRNLLQKSHHNRTMQLFKSFNRTILQYKIIESQKTIHSVPLYMVYNSSNIPTTRFVLTASYGGLANRIHTMISAIYLANKLHKEDLVQWLLAWTFAASVGKSIEEVLHETFVVPSGDNRRN